MNAVVANLHEVADRLAAIQAHDMSELRAKATVLATMLARESEEVVVFSIYLVGDIMNLSRNQQWIKKQRDQLVPCMMGDSTTGNETPLEGIARFVRDRNIHSASTMSLFAA